MKEPKTSKETREKYNEDIVRCKQLIDINYRKIFIYQNVNDKQKYKQVPNGTCPSSNHDLANRSVTREGHK